jgi:hypothetical protein
MRAKKSYDKGGKTKKPKGKTPYPRVHFPAGPNYGDYINQERAAAGGFNKVEKITPRGPKRINNDAAMKAMVTSPKVRKSTATIPVPPAKKKRRPRKRK